MVELFCKEGPVFFPDIKMRPLKMVVANLISFGTQLLDPAIRDRLIIAAIRDKCAALRDKASSDTIRRGIDNLEKRATQRWLTPSLAAKAYQICSRLKKVLPENSADISEIEYHLYRRAHKTSRLKTLFSQAAIGLGQSVKKNWANDYLFDPVVARDTFVKYYGESRVSEGLRSHYLPACNAEDNSKLTMFALKKNILTTDRAAHENAAVSPHDYKSWDAVMATTANEMAFPPHVTENGIVCVDRAPLHTPLRCANDVVQQLRETDRNARVKIVVLGTGTIIDKKRGDKTAIINEIKNLGVAGNFARNHTLEQLEIYNNSDVRQTIAMNGVDYVEISPRRYPLPEEEEEMFPATDTLDGSKANIEKIVYLAKLTLVEQDGTIRTLTQELVDNLYRMGGMTEEKYIAVSHKIKTASVPPLETGIGRNLDDIFNQVHGNRWGRKIKSALGKATMSLIPRSMLPP